MPPGLHAPAQRADAVVCHGRDPSGGSRKD